MNFSIFILLSVFLSLPVGSEPEILTVLVKNVKNGEGFVLVALARDKKSFLKAVDIGKKAKAGNGEITVEFENLTPGKYALSVYHDENNNGKLDTNHVGIPTEGFGFGNNAMGKFGPPPFEKALILWEGKSKTETVTLRY